MELSTRTFARFQAPGSILLIASAASADTSRDTSSRPGGWIEAAVTVRDQNGEMLEAAPELWVDDEVAPQCGFGARAPAQGAVSLFFDRGCPAGC
jgi:hypothetical protein